MGAMVIGIGIAVVLVGIAAGFNGLAIYQSSFGNTLVVLAGFAFVGGLLLVALGLILRALVRIEDRLAGAVHFEPEDEDLIDVAETVAEDAAPSTPPAIVPPPVPPARPSAAVVATMATAAVAPVVESARLGGDTAAPSPADEGFRIDTGRFADALRAPDPRTPEPRLSEPRIPEPERPTPNRMPDLRAGAASVPEARSTVAPEPVAPAPDLSGMRAAAPPPLELPDDPIVSEAAAPSRPAGLPSWFRRREPAIPPLPAETLEAPAPDLQVKPAAPELRHSFTATDDEDPFRSMQAPREEPASFAGLSRPAEEEADASPTPELASEPVGGETAEGTEPAAPEIEPQGGQPAILKSGIIAGMAYTLYADGSIEAELPDGVIRFSSIQELRDHVSGAVQRQG
ncbi:hypothetical protein MWN34_05580 [Ancylobacter sp. 6x-1]|uniref:DUF308 domain-containing protein n=1 Tax=Ancylobacter crimeensis TaxID=2579147 RepID=A0ABT0D9A3_9HYPH|nr:hypothetical protein [Ancylobacter crimeensis]MCK0196382.1 hypothetical protein [Ancylobacter crimeensis]